MGEDGHATRHLRLDRIDAEAVVRAVVRRERASRITRRRSLCSDRVRVEPDGRVFACTEVVVEECVDDVVEPPSLEVRLVRVVHLRY